MSRYSRTPESIGVWRDHACDGDDGVSEYYSVSLLCGAEEEITCLGGGTLEDAWDMARASAEDRGLPARLLGERDEVVEVYVPGEPAAADDDDEVES